MGLFGGGDTKTKTKTVYTIAPEQRELLGLIVGTLRGKIGTGATDVMPAGVRELWGDWLGGEPSYEFDPAAVESRWKKTYATPVMQTWRDTVLPMLREDIGGIPGALYSRGMADYVTGKAGEFYGGMVAPQLFSALQAGEAMGIEAKERTFGRQATAAQQIMADLMRLTPEEDPWTRMLMGMGPTATAPTMETIAFQGAQSPWGGILAGAGAGGLMASMGLLGEGVGLGGGAALGGLLALSDARCKENVTPIENALDIVMKLEGKTYNFHFTPDVLDAGLLAQDLEKVMPEAVTEIDGVKFVKYDAVIGLLISAVGELARKVGV